MRGTQRRFRSGCAAAVMGAIVGLVVCPGCGRAARSRPVETFHTEVTVVLDGSPVAGAAVFFAPVGDGYAAYGVTDDRGIAALTTFSEGDGAASGAYVVRLSKDQATRDPTVTLPDPDVDPDGYEQAFASMVAEGKSPFESRNLMPEKYRTYDTSGLTATVSPTSTNSFVFAISSTP